MNLIINSTRELKLCFIPLRLVRFFTKLQVQMPCVNVSNIYGLIMPSAVKLELKMFNAINAQVLVFTTTTNVFSRLI